MPEKLNEYVNEAKLSADIAKRSVEATKATIHTVSDALQTVSNYISHIVNDGMLSNEDKNFLKEVQEQTEKGIPAGVLEKTKDDADKFKEQLEKNNIPYYSMNQKKGNKVLFILKNENREDVQLIHKRMALEAGKVKNEVISYKQMLNMYKNTTELSVERMDEKSFKSFVRQVKQYNETQAQNGNSSKKLVYAVNRIKPDEKNKDKLYAIYYPKSQVDERTVIVGMMKDDLIKNGNAYDAILAHESAFKRDISHSMSREPHKVINIKNMNDIDKALIRGNEIYICSINNKKGYIKITKDTIEVHNKNNVVETFNKFEKDSISKLTAAIYKMDMKQECVILTSKEFTEDHEKRLDTVKEKYPSIEKTLKKSQLDREQEAFKFFCGLDKETLHELTRRPPENEIKITPENDRDYAKITLNKTCKLLYQETGDKQIVSKKSDIVEEIIPHVPISATKALEEARTHGIDDRDIVVKVYDDLEVAMFMPESEDIDNNNEPDRDIDKDEPDLDDDFEL